VPDAVNAVAVMGRDDVRPTVDNTPRLVTLPAVKVPTDAVVDVTAAAVTAPATDTAADLTNPVTLAAFATKPPTTDMVWATLLPTTTDSALGPMRTTPLTAPVPASSTRSPPALPLWPLACANTYDVRAALVVDIRGRANVNNPSLPSNSDPCAITAPAELRPALEITPPVDREEAVTADAVSMPVDREPVVTAPAEVMLATVTGPDVRRDDEVISPTVTAPNELKPPATTTPDTDRPEPVNPPTALTPPPPTLTAKAVMEPAVTDPLTDTLAARTPPVTDAVLETSAPRTVVVVVVAPTTTALAAGPTRTTPAVAPVPASRTRSPPALFVSPAA